MYCLANTIDFLAFSLICFVGYGEEMNANYRNGDADTKFRQTLWLREG